ncbi:protein of unknown function [Taphrina deformans PYCC 5710]|uniref:Alternative oxidase n=1 Tax=Taphrina deformans (strain PYCC 5710 / ATCC 11124 / CBS 356.35 / IMI 108563 / JCM 9778 / NBRC 8474) TaxID=1097556 RepID=R4XGA5_TAPDE|nr:protein of unknown function [Taphrina deformans PYCC 5710]|eukprot:CCG84932.1 protein of unknown function [Taphrina deformans PYCC 5710]
MFRPAIVLEKVQQLVGGLTRLAPAYDGLSQDEFGRARSSSFFSSFSAFRVQSDRKVIYGLIVGCTLGLGLFSLSGSSSSSSSSSSSTGADDRFSITSALGGLGSSSRPAGTRALEREIFNLLGEGGDFDPAPIENLCNHKRFQPGLYVRCNENDGGVGNVRNSILLCTRYAVESGAHLVAPRIHLRSTSDLADLGGDRVNMTYLFDYDVYRARIEGACPGFRLYESADEVPTAAGSLHIPPDRLDPLDFHGHGGLINTHILDHRADLRGWLWNQVQVHPSLKTPVLVDLARTFFGWANTQDSYEVWHEWSRILPFQPETYHVAAQILSIMSKLDAEQLAGEKILQNSYRYVGQHLRTEGDVSPEMKAYGFDTQMDASLALCREKGITELYIASGDVGEAAKATMQALDSGITVHTKYSLMTADAQLASAILAMTFDQQALIDYLIMSKATSFVGVDSSSFSGNIAVLRHAALGDQTHWHGFSDELSLLIGDRFEWLREAMWA